MSAKRLPAAIIILGRCLTPGIVPLAEAEEAKDWAWIDHRQLAAGEILISVDEDGRFRGHIEAAVLVAAPAEDIWAVLEDCESAPEYVPNVLSCELIETLDGGRAGLYRQEVKFAWFMPRFEHVFRLDFHPYRRIDVEKVAGPIERLQGSWWLMPEPDGRTVLAYSLDFDPGLPVPRFLVGATLRRDLPRILSAIRERAQAAH